jgi:DNA-binding transcriptional regulator YiaG
MDGWTAKEANQLRELLNLKPDAFARRLKIHQRTVMRWRDGDTDPAPGFGTTWTSCSLKLLVS